MLAENDQSPDDEKTAGNVYRFPALKSIKGKIDPDNVTEEKLEAIVYDLMHQVLWHVHSLGFELDKVFFEDFEFVNDAFLSALMRNVGKYHQIQDLLDDVVAAEEIDKNH